MSTPLTGVNNFGFQLMKTGVEEFTPVVEKNKRLFSGQGIYFPCPFCKRVI